MSNKRFLVPVLALAAMAVSARASIVEYCSGSSTSCSTNSQTAFNNALTADTFTGVLNFSSSNGTLSGSMYTDTATGIVFEDFQGNALTYSGGILSTPFGDDTINIILPSTIVAISLTINVTRGLCDNYCVEGETSGFLGFITDGTGSWTGYVSPNGSGGYAQINSFSAATTGTTPPPSETPEVGTLLLIGAGLISMRLLRHLPRKLFRPARTLRTA
jgi:hypothetical protein